MPFGLVYAVIGVRGSNRVAHENGRGQGGATFIRSTFRSSLMDLLPVSSLPNFGALSVLASTMLADVAMAVSLTSPFPSV